MALDVAQDGPADAKKIALISSAVDGVEGFCGSGIQVQALRDRSWRKQVLGGNSNDVAVLYLHAINPWGFSHLRRVTHENVGMNRNFPDFSKPLPANVGFRELRPLLLPSTWPPAPEVQQQVQQYIATRGMKGLQAAASAGQYEFAGGLFFGGHAPTWSNTALHQVLRDYCGQASHVAWVDLHTGLGPTGVGERIYSGHEGDPGNYARCARWWGNAGAAPITRLDDGSTSPADLNGTIRQCVDTELAHAEATKITLEFGTALVMQGLQAMRAEQWLKLHPETPAPKAAVIKQALRDYFYVDTHEWKTQIPHQGLQTLAQMVGGLSEPAQSA